VFQRRGRALTACTRRRGDSQSPPGPAAWCVRLAAAPRRADLKRVRW
jgi:hypothetical protein